MEILIIVAAICFVLALVALFIVAGIRLVRALVATLFRKPADQAKPGPALTVTVETRPVRPARSGNRKRTADWPALLDRDDVLVVDTETTGLGGTAEVVEVGVVDTTGKVRLHVLSMPQSRMPREASAIHGLTRGHPTQYLGNEQDILLPLEPNLHTLVALIAEQPDRTLVELKDGLGTPASLATTWRAVQALVGNGAGRTHHQLLNGAEATVNAGR